MNRTAISWPADRPGTLSLERTSESPPPLRNSGPPSVRVGSYSFAPGRESLPPESPAPRSEAPLSSDSADERARIARALENCGGNQTHAARMLGVSRRTLISRIERYDLPRPRKR